MRISRSTALPYVAPVLFSLIAVALMLRFDQSFPKDDGAFFLRYAVHIASGQGYVWNPGEHDGIGASAPLWPPLIAVFIKAGIEPFAAIKTISILTCTTAFFLFFLTSIAYDGQKAAVLLLVAIAGSGLVYGEAIGGLETPLTLLLLGMSCLMLVRGVRNPYAICLLAALLIIHKLDMAPWAFGLFVSARLPLKEKKTGCAIAAATLSVAAFFIAMKLGTDHFFPVSLTHKLAQSWNNNSGRVSRLWFMQTAFVDYRRWAVTVPALLALPWLLRGRTALVYFLVIGIAGQTLGYCLFPPSEAFIWYACACMMGINMLLAAAVTLLPTPLYRAGYMLLLGLGMFTIAGGETIRHIDIANARFVEADRANAGIWVNVHTPPTFKVTTGFGNPAFYANRYIYDYSGLNRAGQSDLPYIIKTYAPEIIILCPWRTGVTPQMVLESQTVTYFNYTIPSNYKAVKYFDSALQSGYDDFYALILVRRDALAQLK